MRSETKEISSIGTVRAFYTKGACSTTLMHVLNRAFGNPMELAEQASIPFAGGIVQQGYQCGMLWGATLAAGAQAYRLFGPGARAEAAAMLAAQRLVEAFLKREGEINCLELTETDWNKKGAMFKFFIKGGSIACTRRAVRFAPIAFEVINRALAEADESAPSIQASCAARLARKMGASDMHAVMAAGLAGGIGLSGGACGALGAAMWITAMRNPGENAFKRDGDTKVGETIDRFLKASDHEFECAEITGRKFESAQEHGRFVCNGGCARILAALAGEGGQEEATLAEAS